MGWQEPPGIIRNTFGEVGLLDMPSGHMAPRGQMAFVVGDLGSTQRYAFSFQRNDWFEGTIRYSAVAGLFPKQTNFHDRSAGLKFRLMKESDLWPDVSIGIRDFLGTGVYSSEYVVASKHIGPFDLTAGMGFGQLADRNVLPNPLGLVVHQYKVRPPVSFGAGGIPDFQVFYRGRVGLFGGAVWQTPIEGLSVLAEYSTIKYEGYSFPGAVKIRSPLNLGLSYRPADFFAISGGWFYGSTYGFTVTVNGDATTTYPSVMRVGPKVPPPALRPDNQQKTALTIMGERGRQALSMRGGGPWVHIPTPDERSKQDLLQAFMSEGRGVRNVEINGKSVMVDAHLGSNSRAQCSQYAQIASSGGSQLTTVAVSDLQDPNGAVTFCQIASNGTTNIRAGNVSVASARSTQELRPKIKADLEAQRLQLDALMVGTSELTIYYENNNYLHESEAIGRVARVLMADAPASVEVFHIVAARFGVPQQEMTVVRSALERTVQNYGTAEGMGDALSLTPAPLNSPEYDRQVSELYPTFNWSLDPKLTGHLFDPDHPLQLLVFADAVAMMQLGQGLGLVTEWTGKIWTNYTYDRAAGSNLPHVRTDLLRYLKDGAYGMSALEAVYRSRLAPDVYTEFKAGYLEDMYAGAGAQILWRPQGSRLSFGGDIYQVWKRDFNRLFGLQRYNIVTGHLSVYYETPYNNTNVAIHAGRYLAGDYGATLEVTKRFSTGVEVGAWATFTNVPFAKFGEGSFDKGFIIRIPFEWGLPIWSQSSFDFRLPSLTRDGGQRVVGDDSLFEDSRGASYGEIAGHLDDVVEP